jgi:hypothetical protein
MKHHLETAGKLTVLVSAIAGGVIWVASKDYVDERTKAINAYVQGETISKITRYKCRNPDDSDFDMPLSLAKSKHIELVGREYKMPSCEKLGIEPDAR